MRQPVNLPAIIDKIPRSGCARTATLHMIQRGFTLVSFTVAGFGIVRAARLKITASVFSDFAAVAEEGVVPQ